MGNVLLIRQETPSDYDVIHRVVQEAFASAAHRDGTEQDLVAALRKGDTYIPELALMAIQGETIVGHILFTRATIEGRPILALAPLAVLPKVQRQGIGSALVREGHRIASAMGFECSVVLGDSAYYARFGYAPASRFGIQAPFSVPDENFMAAKLRPDATLPAGVVRYAAAFGL